MQRGTRIVDRYELIEPIGGGTFGEVWHAMDGRFAHRPVAVKFLKPEYQQDAEVVARFLLESDALCALQHAQVVGVFDRGVWDGTHFLVMEYVRGVTLKAWITERWQRGSPTDPSEALRIFLALCDGVGAAHRLAPPVGPLIHRDLKPGNVIVHSDAHGRLMPKILDFGIAQLGGRRMTRTGAVLGSPSYMAPEQAEGAVREICPATDVFALGVVLLEMSAGRQRVIDSEPVWSTARSRGVDASMIHRVGIADAAIAAVLLRCFQSSPGHRYHDARALADDLLQRLDATTRSDAPAALEATVWSPPPPKPFVDAVRVPTAANASPATPAWLRVIAALAHWMSALAIVLVATVATYRVVQFGDAPMLAVAAVSGLVAAGAVVAALGISLRLPNAHAVALALDVLLGAAIFGAEWGSPSALVALPLAGTLAWLAWTTRVRHA